MISGQCTETHRRASHESSESDCSQRHYIAAARNSVRSAAAGKTAKEETTTELMTQQPSQDRDSNPSALPKTAAGFELKLGGTVYEVSTHFDPESRQCVLAQFMALMDPPGAHRAQN